jgi:glycerol-3-phosphate dehydrogenase
LKRDLNQFQSEEYDLLVVGGGIYGASICWEAVSRGLRVALIEKSDFGSATSANSLKIIHGGFRYLQSFNLNRVKESIREQKALMNIAPHLVHPLPVLVPTYGHGIKGKEAFSTGLRLFNYLRLAEDQLADPDKHIPPSRFISRDECIELLPSVNRDGLNGGALFFDAQVYNSERLIISFLHSASIEGAHNANYAEVIDFVKDNDRIKGVKVRDVINGEVFEVRAKIIVLACGPWNEQLMDMIDSSKAKHPTKFAKAVNLVTHKLIDKYAVGILGKNLHLSGNLLPGGKKSYLFVTPWRSYSIIGTAYSLSENNADEALVNEKDITFLLNEFNQVYPGANLSKKDVLFAHGGLLPVSKSSANDHSINLAEKFEITDHMQRGYDGLVSVKGVKYTTARDVAEKTIDYLFPKLGYEFVPSISAKTRLYGGDITRFGDFLSEAEKQLINELSEKQIRDLIFNFGSVYPEVRKNLKDSASNYDGQDENLTLLAAQIRYTVNHEMAQKLGDVILRRTELGSAGHPGDTHIEFAAEIMGKEMGWSQSRIDEEVADIRKAFSEFHTEEYGQPRERVGDQTLQ